MQADKDLLLMSAARLYSLGVEAEAAREKLRELVARGVPYDSKEMSEAYREFARLDQLWKDLETDHLALRNKLMKKRKGGKPC